MSLLRKLFLKVLNAFTQSLHIIGKLIGTHFPIHVARNKLCGSIEIGELPSSLELIFIHNNLFTGPMRVGFPPTTVHLIHMRSSGITLVIGANGKEMPRTKMELVEKAERRHRKYFFIEGRQVQLRQRY